MRRALSALLAGLLAVSAIAAVEPGDVTAELSPRDGRTAVSLTGDSRELFLGGEVPPGSEPTATLQALDDADAVLETYDVSGAVTVTDGAVSGSVLVTCSRVPGCLDATTDEERQAAIDALAGYRLELTVEDVSDQSNIVDFDAEPPLIEAYALTSPTTIEVRFTEDVTDPDGDAASDWEVNDSRQVYSVQGIGDTRVLTFLVPVDEDATPKVWYHPTPSPDPNLPNRPYIDGAGNELDAPGRLANAIDRIEPPRPTIDAIEGTAVTYADEDQAVPVLGNDATPEVVVGNVAEGVIAQLWLDDGDGNFEPDTDDTLVGEAPGDGSGTATVVSDPLPGDDVHRFYARSRDEALCDPNDEESEQCPNTSGRSTEGRYDLDTVAPVPVGDALAHASTMVVQFTEPLVGADGAGQWTVANPGGGAVTVDEVSGSGDTRTLQFSGTLVDTPAPTLDWTAPGSDPYRDEHGNVLTGFPVPIEVAPLPLLTVEPADVTEGDPPAIPGDPLDPAPTLDFTLRLSDLPVGETVEVAYETVAGTDADATPDEDYLADDGTVTITGVEGPDEVVVSITVERDELHEFDEAVFLQVSNVDDGAPQFTLPGDAAALTTAADILDDDDPVVATIVPASGDVGEGEDIGLAVQLHTVSGRPVTIDWATVVADDPAEGEAGIADVPAQSGSVTIPAGDESAPFTVEVADDGVDEPDETFSVDLTAPAGANATLGDPASAALTILDDDLPVPTLTVEPGTVAEDDYLLPLVTNAELPFTFTLSEAPEPGQAIEVSWTTDDTGTAGEDVDFTGDSGFVRFEEGETEQQVLIDVTDDDLNEDPETVALRVADPAAAVLVDDAEEPVAELTALGTITDDDPLPTVAFEDGSEAIVVTEGHDAHFTVELDAVSGRDVTVDWATVFGEGEGAADTDDLAAQNGTVTITEGNTTATFTVETLDDGVAEDDETVTIELSDPTAAGLADDRPTTSQLTLADDEDVIPTITLTGGEGLEDPGALPPLTSPTPIGFLVELDQPADQDVTVDYRTTHAGSATSESDFTGTNGTLTIPANETSATIPVPVLDDDLDEPEETVQLVLSSPGGARLEGGVAELPALGTIVDDDPVVTVSVADAEVDEGEPAVVTISLDAASGKTVEVAYRTDDGVGSATAGDDYTSTSGTVTFEPGDREATFTVATLDDPDDESDETIEVVVEATDPGTASVGDGTATVTILDNDIVLEGDPVLSMTGAAVLEGDPTGPVVLPTTTMTFVLQLSEAADGDVDVTYETAPVDATEGSLAGGGDYVGDSGTATIDDGEDSTEITVDVFPDAIDEFDEELELTITGVTSGSAQLPPGGLTRTGRIEDDDPLAVLGFVDGSLDVGVDEGETVELTVERTGATAKPITVDYAISFDGLATTADAPAQSGTLELAPGESEVSFEVETTQDEIDEPSEAFSVVLSSPDNAALDPDTDVATVTIADDDLVVPVLSVSGGSVDEGAAGTFGGFSPVLIAELDPIAPAVIEEDLVFTVTLSEPTEQEVTVEWSTSDGERARAGSDYVAASDTLTIPAFETEAEFTVDVLDDDLDEVHELLEVIFTGLQGATFSTGASTLGESGTIVDDDPLVTATLGDDQEVTEGNPATFEVTLSEVSGKDITIRYRTSNGTATAGQDYQATDDTLTIPAGDTSATFTVPTLDDSVAEPIEDAQVTLSVVHDDTAELDRSTGTLTINDDDLDVDPDDTVVSLTGDAVEEGDPVAPLPLPVGGNSLGFEVRLSEPADGDVVIDYETRAGTATADDDFEPAEGQVTIPDGQRQATVSVGVVGDFLDEFDEDLRLVLTDVSGNAVLPAGQLVRTGRILDDDPAAQLRVSDATVLEGGVAELDVTLDNPSGKDITVDWALVDGSATAGDDYVADSGTLSFPAGTTSRTVQVATLADDDTGEFIEQFELVLSDATNAGIDDPRGTISIVDIGADGLPTTTAVFLEDVTTQEADTDTTVFVPVRLSSERDQDTTVTWSTQQLTATEGDDFRAEGGQVVVPAGSTSAQIRVTIVGDDEVEPNEDFLVLLTQAEGAVITGPTGRVTIEDDDGADDGGGDGSDGGGDGSGPGGDGDLDGAPDSGDQRAGELPATGGGIGLGMVALAALLARRRRD